MNIHFPLRNKYVFITGASSGIGKACAELFAANGAHLIITARRFERLKSLALELIAKHHIKCLPFALDVKNPDEILKITQELEKQSIAVDFLINNAGLALSSDKIQDANIENWNVMIDTNIKGLLFVTKSLLPGMIKRNQGHIINIGSIAGHSCYLGGNVYCATKHAVKAISRSLRLDLLGYRIRVTEIDPGAVETEFSEVRFQDKQRAKEVYRGFSPLIAQDIAECILFAATRKEHVNISEMIVYPQAQASITDILRDHSIKS